MNVLIDTSPLQSGHAIRGIGVYTRLLVQELRKLPEITVHETGDEGVEKTHIDLIHYPFFDFFAGTLPLWKTSPSVVTIHDVVPLLFPDQYPAGVKGKIAFGRQWSALRRIDAIITDSHAAGSDIITQLKIAPEKIFPIHLAANPEMGRVVEEQVALTRKKFRLPKKYILYVGDINYNKNLPQLIKAMKYVPNEYYLVLVGKNFRPQPIPEWKAIEQQIALSDMVKRTKYVNKIGADDAIHLAAMYCGATVYVQPSLYEGFGLPVLEAMRCMVPVVAAARGSLPEITDHHALLVEPDAEAIAVGIKHVLEWRRHEREEKTSDAFAWQQQFTWQRTAQHTVQVYRQVLEKQ
jgi:glycosyltransferase involved in cell wall biosynthesis